MSRDFRDLLSGFSAASVEYLVVGAHALAAHGHVRATKDLDIWIAASRENASRTLRAIAEFGAPLHGLTAEDLMTRGLIFQIGVEPLRIDILTAIDGVEFSDAWPNRLIVPLFGLQVPVLSRDDLIRNKKASGRLQDLADVERLGS
jgi:hypothetical protein